MSSAADPRWAQLTLSTKAAWRWAYAVATTRSASAEPSDKQVDTLDLLVGLTLAHLRDNPVSQLLAHFQIPPGAVLSDDGTRRYDPTALLDAYRRTSASELPPLDEQAAQVLEHALAETPASKDGLITLSMLFAALLENTNTASAALRGELSNRGVAPEQVIQSCREHLGTRTSYAEHLRKTHPYQPPELQLPPYCPDEPRTRRPPAALDTDPADMVGISAEVNAFAYLIAAKTLTPPLAIGLFGDWGSGKSYFLRSLQRRIDRLVTEADQPPFHRAVVQVEFNAWQYVEGNLWASLLEHLFRNLRKAGEHDADDLLEERRSEYLAQITKHTTEHSRAARKRDEAAEERAQADQLVLDKREERDRKLEELEQAQRRNPLRYWQASDDLRRTLDDIGNRTGLGELATQADELRQTLASTGETLRQAGPVLGALRTGGLRYTLALLLVIGLGPLIAFILSRFDVSAVGTLIGSGSAVLAGISGYAAQGSRAVAGTLGKISRAQAELTKELDARRDQFDEEIRQAEHTLADTQRDLDSAIADEQRCAASVAALQAELDRITPSSVLAEFLDDRFASDDYRRHLGVPALVRQDLDRLSRLIQQRHDTGSTEGIDDRHAIDRVVLYIDDLDRCPTDMVIKVLEAVHLLLAFPLFVVVVAVDARWLESSLREHYTQLRPDAPGSPDTAVPSDYLEKIFQVPFWVRPLGADTRRRMARRLLEPNLAGPDPATAPSAAQATGPELSDADLPEFTRLVGSFAVTEQAQQLWPDAAMLTVTGPELRQVEDIATLISATPRAVKRFINVYLLLRSMGRSRSWPLPEHGQVAILLALATGLPDLADELLPRLAAAPGTEPLTLGTALPTVPTGQAAGTQLARLSAWLDDHPTWRDVALGEMERWIELILRFRFDRGTTAHA